MKRVLILTVGYGEGHNAAARALAPALSEIGFEAEVRDFFLETYGPKQELSRHLYLDCIERAPLLWLITYKLLDWLPVMQWVISPSLYSMQARLGRALAEWRPDAVVCVFPGYTYLLDRLYPKGGAPFSRHTLVTDSISVNSTWYRAGSDTWLVPNEDTAAVMRAAGVPEEKTHVTGFPIPACFADNRPTRPLPGKAEPFRVLCITNSARGSAPALIARLLELDGIQLTVTVGRDAALGRQVEALAAAAGRTVEIHGWTKRMPELLMTHHVVIGKAGGAATQEAIAAQTPIIITKIVPGQEQGNADLVRNHHVGAVATSPAAVCEQIRDLIADDFALWHRWHAEIQRISRPNAARDTARFILDHQNHS